jgi:diadenosine tetraphosphatase ApaH/serine/threonine PP2A family protein phosphatase
MLVGIIADLHANLEATLAVFRRLDEIRPDRLVCLGDLAGYNTNPNEVIDIIRERRIPCLMGNHDAAASGLEEPWFFNSRAQAALKWQIERLRDDNRQFLRELPEQLAFHEGCLGVHGSPGNRDDYILDWLDAVGQVKYLEEKGAWLCFFGHSHHASLFSERGAAHINEKTGRWTLYRGNRYFINPGAVGQPRDRDPRAAFGIFDTEANTFEFHRVPYDIETTARKILAVGLPPELAARLSAGR